MRRGRNIGIALTLLAGWLSAQNVVSNPKQAAAPNSGRVVELRLQEAVKSGSGPAALKGPSRLRVAPDGTIIMHDGNRLAKFDPEGNFIKDLYGWDSNRSVVAGSYSGGRPQIAQAGFSFVLDGSDIVCCDLAKSQVFTLDIEGKTKNEINLAEPILGAQVVAAKKGRILLSGRPLPAGGMGMGGGMMDPVLFSLSADGAKLTPIATFSAPYENQSQIQDGPVQYSNFRVAAPLNISVSGDRFAYASHTAEFQVKVLDLETGQILRTFKRDYDRVENTDPSPTAGSSLNMGGSAISPPRLKIKNDIAGLYPRGDRIWVLTSTFDKNKGTLIDVFDAEGRYVDSFYLKAEVNGQVHSFDGLKTWLTGNTVYFAVKDPDGTHRIFKSPLLDGV